MRRSAVVFVAGLAACAHGPSGASVPDGEDETAPLTAAPIVSRQLVGQGRVRMPGVVPKRPDVVASHPFDYASLPALEALKDQSPTTTFSITQTELGFRLVSPHKTPARIQIGAFLAFSSPNAATRTGFKMQLATTPPPCMSYATSNNPSPIVIESMGPSPLGDAFIRFVHEEGSLDFLRCTGEMKRVATVSAAALIPGLLYAFRRCPGRCWGNGSESLVVIAPAARWVVTSTDTQPAPSQSGPFTTLSIRISRGESASFLLHADASAITRFRSARGSKAKASKETSWLLANEVVALSVEVVWPMDDDKPEGLAYLSAASDLAKRALDVDTTAPAR